MDTMTFIRENWGNTVRACWESRKGNSGLPYPYFVRLYQPVLLGFLFHGAGHAAPGAGSAGQKHG